MAANQLGYTLVKQTSQSDISIGGSLRLMSYSVAPTASSYFTGGYKITPANVGLNAIYNVNCETQVPPGGTPITSMVLPFWDYTNSALQFFQSAGSATVFGECTSAQDLSAYVFLVNFVGN